jgi:hypothetical protein
MRLMKLKGIFIVLGVFFVQGVYAQKYKAKDGKVKFLSEEVLENIEAKSNKLIGALDTNSQKVAFLVRIKSFEFKLDKMKEHFNEDYMESSDFPKATFSGKINEDIDYSIDSTYEVSVTGGLNIHGVKKERTIKGTLQVKGGVLILSSSFNIKLADHDIKVPKLMFQKIAEVVGVKMSMTMKEVVSTKKD